MFLGLSLRHVVPSLLPTGDYWYVATDGGPSGDGTLLDPWDLLTALDGAGGEIGPGDTVFVRGGTYVLGEPVTVVLEGAAELLITFKAYEQELPVIDLVSTNSGEQYDLTFHDDSQYLRLEGFEITCSDPDTRVSGQSGSSPTDQNRGNLINNGKFNQFVNNTIHDIRQVATWLPAEGDFWYGNLIYNCGWQGTDRGHGHAFYIQNYAVSAPKFFRHNVAWNQYGAGFHIYGSISAEMQNIHMFDNVIANNPVGQFLLNGGTPMNNQVIVDNHVYVNLTDLPGGAIGFDLSDAFDDVPHGSIVFTGNYVTDSEVRLFFAYEDVEFHDNRVFNTMTGGKVVRMSEAQPGTGTYVWDDNAYFCPTALPFAYLGSSKSLATWQSDTGFDAASTISTGNPPDSVHFEPNLEDTNRGLLVIYNFTLEDDVAWDPTGWLSADQDYAIYHINQLDVPVKFGTWVASDILVPMAAIDAPKPIGHAGRAALGFAKSVGVFVVRKQTYSPELIEGESLTSETIAATSADLTAAHSGESLSAEAFNVASAELTYFQLGASLDDGAITVPSAEFAYAFSGDSLDAGAVNASAELDTGAPADIELIGSVETTAITQTSITVPSGEDGDLLVFIWHNHVTNEGVPAPSGFTQQLATTANTGRHLWIGYRFVQAGDPTSYDCSPPHNTIIVRLRNVHSTPVDIQSSYSGDTLVCPSVNTSHDGSRCLRILGARAAYTGIVCGSGQAFTMVQFITNTTGADDTIAVALDNAPVATAGASGTRSFTTGSGDASFTLTLALRRAA